MMHIAYVSEAAALDLVPSHAAALISITEPGRDAPLVHPEQWGELLRVRFCDAEYSEEMLRKLEAKGGYFDADAKGFPSEMTSLIVMRFIESLRERGDIDSLYVHCHAGQRRSAAVAKFAAEQLGAEFDHGYSGYNKTVYALLHDPARFAQFARRSTGVGVIQRLFGLFKSDSKAA